MNLIESDRIGYMVMPLKLINDMGPKKLSKMFNKVGFFVLSTHEPALFNLDAPDCRIYLGVCDDFDKTEEGKQYSQYGIRYHVAFGQPVCCKLVKLWEDS